MKLLVFIIIDIVMFYGAWISYKDYKPYPYIRQGVFIFWFLFFGFLDLIFILNSWEYLL